MVSSLPFGTELGFGLNYIRAKGQRCAEAQGREEISGEFVVACAEAPEVLESAEAALDDVAAFVSLLVMANALFPIGFAGNDRPDLVGFEEGAERIGVVAFVSEELVDAGDKADAGFCNLTICSIARREDQDPGTAKVVDNRMNLAISATLGDAYLRLRPPFPPLAQRWILP